MPQISKIRVVNCWYNNGKRLIPDETFDFLSPSAQPNNTLIALANGGGKSVLVQMMLQPVCPLKSLGRKIGDYFEKASDHCYILLEWKLDGSNENLLTGISISAGARTENDEDTDNKNRTLKHYTFTAKYLPSASGDYTIDNLPLSSLDNGQFKAQTFSYIRDLAKNKNNLTVYSDSEHEKYRRELLNHGISRFEWENVISKVNLVEGGLIKYFEAFRTSDSLINNLLIRTIEDNQNSSDEDQKLKNLFINFASEYSKQRENEERRAYAAEFRNTLIEKQSSVDHLRSLNESLMSSKADMRGFIKALGEKLAQLRKEGNDTQDLINSLKDKIRHLRYEEASLNYYNVNAVYLGAKEEYENSQRSYEDTGIRYETADKNLRIMRCAHENEEIRRLTGEKQAAENAVAEKSGDTEYLDRSQKLAFSVFAKSNDEIKKNEIDINVLSESKAECETKIKEAENQAKQLDKQYQKLTSLCDNCSGRLSGLNETIKKKSDELKLDIVQKLDSTYETQIITDKQKSLNSRADDISNEKEGLADEKEKIQTRKQELIDEKIALSVKIRELENELRHEEQNLTEYYQASEKIKKLCQLYSIPEDSIFNGRLTQVLSNLVKQTKAESEDVRHHIILQSEQIEAARKGCLHIPQAVLKYLDSAGTEYQTCEKYLQSGSYSKEKINEMLTLCPELAFGIVVFDDDYERILKDSTAEWLPCAVPVFRYDDISNCAQGKGLTSNRMIACYSKRYFDDPDGCCSDFEEELGKLNKTYDALEERLLKLDDELDVCRKFQYSSDFEKKQKSTIESVSKTSEDTSDKLSAIIKEDSTADARLMEINKQSYMLDNEIHNISSTLSQLDDLMKYCEKCHSLLNEISGYKDSLKDIWQKKNEIRDVITSQTAKYDEYSRNLKNASDTISKLSEYVQKYKDTPESEIIDSDIDILLAELNKLNETQNSSIESLNKEIEKYAGLISRCRKEINRLKIDEELYAGVIYSSDEEDEFLKQCDTLKQQLALLEDLKNEKQEKMLKLMSRREFSEEKLNDFSADKKPLPENEISDCVHKEIIRQKTLELGECTEKYDSLCGMIKEISLILQSSGNAQNDENLRVNTIVIGSDPSAQRQQIADAIADAQKELNTSEHDFRLQIDAMKKKLDARDDFAEVFKDIYSVIARDGGESDKYMTLSIHMRDQAQTLSKLINVLDTDLSKLDDKKHFLIEQCQRQGKYVYDELRKISGGSKVRINGHSTPVSMIKLDLNEEIDETAAKTRIEEETLLGINEYLDARDKQVEETVLIKIADRIVGSRNLLNKYTGRDTIAVRVYKIDVNEKNGTYRTWEQSLVKNSGGECFVVYFSVLLSVMSYARAAEACMTTPGIKAGSVLILDNPFGAITSSHLLEPMFQIARKFRVQLICLSDISKCNITKCFDTVIRITIKKLQFSNYEIITPERDDQLEQTEHAFYKTQQISMF